MHIESRPSQDPPQARVRVNTHHSQAFDMHMQRGKYLFLVSSGKTRPFRLNVTCLRRDMDDKRMHTLFNNSKDCKSPEHTLIMQYTESGRVFILVAVPEAY